MDAAAPRRLSSAFQASGSEQAVDRRSAKPSTKSSVALHGPPQSSQALKPIAHRAHKALFPATQATRGQGARKLHFPLGRRLDSRDNLL